MYNDLFKDEKLRDFMRQNQVSFEQILRSAMFWNGLTKKERNNYIDIYTDKN